MTDEKSSAEQDLRDILELQRQPAFQRYMIRRLSEKVEAQRQRVLDFVMNDAPKGEPAKPIGERGIQLLIEQRIYQALLEIARMVDNDMASCKTLLGTNAVESPRG